MNAPMSIQDVLRFFLYLLGIGVLGYLLLAIKNLGEILKNINKLVEKSEENIVKTVQELPEMTRNVNSIVRRTDEAMESMVPEIDGIVHSTNKVTGKIESITSILDNTAYKVSDTVDSVTTDINDVSYNFRQNMNGLTRYMTILTEVLEIIKNILFNNK